MIIGIPLIQILIFGYGINMDVRHIRAGVVDDANTSLSRALVSQLEATRSGISPNGPRTFPSWGA